MKYSNEKIIERLEAGENLKFLLFLGHQKSEQISKCCLSQLYESKFEVNGIKYHTAEHYMMAEKALLFEDKQIYEQIITSAKSGKVKELGRKVRNFKEFKLRLNLYKYFLDLENINYSPHEFK